MKRPTFGVTDNYPTRNLWKEIAKEQNGKFRVKHDSGKAFEIHEIIIPYKNWHILLTVSDTRPFKVQINFKALQNLNFIAGENDLIERIIATLTKQRITFGRPEFDKRYLVISRKSALVKQIFTNEIRETILKHNIYSIAYQTGKTKKTAEIISVIHRVIGSKKEILELINMFKSLIDNLEKTRIIK